MRESGGQTDYMGELYAGPLGGAVMRGYMGVSLECCPAFGTLACVDCPLVEFVPSAVPGCGMASCLNCSMRCGCPCGNEKLRQELLEEIGVEKALTGE